MANYNYKSMAAAGYDRLLKLWEVDPESLVNKGFWHAANALETIVDYMAATGTEDSPNIVSRSLSLYQKFKPTPPPNNPSRYWFDDQGWWGSCVYEGA